MHQGMSKSTQKRLAIKPRKPYPDFTLFPHAAGRWAKKIRGKLDYFGPWADAAAAGERSAEQWESLHAGPPMLEQEERSGRSHHHSPNPQLVF